MPRDNDKERAAWAKEHLVPGKWIRCNHSHGTVDREIERVSHGLEPRVHWKNTNRSTRVSLIIASRDRTYIPIDAPSLPPVAEEGGPSKVSPIQDGIVAKALSRVEERMERLENRMDDIMAALELLMTSTPDDDDEDANGTGGD